MLLLLSTVLGMSGKMQRFKKNEGQSDKDMVPENFCHNREREDLASFFELVYCVNTLQEGPSVCNHPTVAPHLFVAVEIGIVLKITSPRMKLAILFFRSICFILRKPCKWWWTAIPKGLGAARNTLWIAVKMMTIIRYLGIHCQWLDWLHFTIKIV